MTIRGSARATAVRIAPLVAVVLVMAWLQGIDSAGRLTWWGYVCLGLAGALAVPALANLFWPPTLLLQADAVVCRWWWSTTTIKWTDIQTFRVVSPKDQLSRRIPHVLPWNVAIHIPSDGLQLLEQFRVKHVEAVGGYQANSALDQQF